MAKHTITKSPAVRVQPASTTPSEILSLSSIDRCTPGRMSIDYITVFTDGVKAAACIRDAFAKALIHYYPIAGKITELKPGEPEVDCTGDGIWFVQADANCTLEEVNYLERPLMISKEQLLPQAPPETKVEDEIAMVQVTAFTCGGFTLGICSSHLVFDGLGFAQFIKAVGEMARGLPEPTVKPVWFRENIPDPPKVPLSGPPPAFTVFNLATSVVDISSGSINRIKELYMAETGKKGSSFEVVTAMILKSRTRAINLAPEAEVRLGFAANTRHLLHHVLPSVEGYYGNCLYPMSLTMSSEDMNNASLLEVMSVVKGAKDELSTKFLNWMYGRTESYHNLPLDYGTMVLTDWSRVGLNEVDFGWGQSKCVFPLNDDLGIIASVIYLNPPVPKKGIRLMLRCVKEEHSAVFSEELAKLAKLA